MIKKRIVLFLVLILGLLSDIDGAIVNLRVNRLVNPSGIVDMHPMLSWQITSKSHNVMQTAYEIVVRSGAEVVWQTGKVMSDCSIGVPYEGKPLVSGTRYSWRVRVWDNKNRVSTWSNPSGSWLTGLYSIQEWKAQWIEPAGEFTKKNTSSPIMRKQFRLTKPILSAVAYITSHGMNEIYLNGKKIGNYHYAPGWTAYGKRLQYYTYDVTSSMQQGENACGIMLGQGWMLSPMSWNRNYKYADITSSVGAYAQIVITYKDSSHDTIATDSTWKYSYGEVQNSTIYDGETIDANKIQYGWNDIGFDDAKWSAVQVAYYDNRNLVNCENEPVVTHSLVNPVKLLITPKGEKVIDFGQNLVGSEIVTVKGFHGQKITISHAEVLDEKGNFYTTNLRSAKAQSCYICSGNADTFQPHFTFYGFRYIKVDGWNGNINPEDFKAAVNYSSFEENGNFSCSNDTVNRLQSNIQWGLRGNFIDIPTDCPQRDERLGWTGDAQVFFRTATFNARVENFFKKWLKDLMACQRVDGRVANVIPDVLDENDAGRTGWADASTIIPWEHYMAYGDKQILINQYPSMKAWVDYMSNQSKDYLWTSGWHFGDWLAFSAPNDCDGRSSVTSKRLIQQCFFAHSAYLVSRAAETLENDVDAAKYKTLSNKAKDAFCNAYLTKAGYLMSDTQTAYVLALYFNMLPDSMRQTAARRLAELVNEYGHITTGFLGTPYICDVLTQNGYNDLAYKLLMHKEYPGWLYPVTMGATTIWERWNSMMPDCTIPDNGMNSFNHYSYGAIGDWLYRDAVGIQETSPGFKTIRIMPHIGGDFSSMYACENTPFGEISASWKINANTVSLNVVIPVNTTAEIFIPAKPSDIVTMNGKCVKNYVSLEGYAVVKVGSGKYVFLSQKTE
jgi:alpha-L-rhamnosidase